MGFIDFIFPKKCVCCKKQGSYLCEKCFSYLSFNAKSACLICKRVSFNNLTHARCKRRYSIDGCFSALSYSKTMRKLIYSFKDKPYLSDLRTVLSDLFYESIIQNEQFAKEIKKGKWVLVPVSLSPLKLRKRGYNQAEILAKELSKRFNFPVKTIFQDDNTMLKNQNVFLVDDVVISGSTLLKTTKVLKKTGVQKVFGLTLAR